MNSVVVETSTLGLFIVKALSRQLLASYLYYILPIFISSYLYALGEYLIDLKMGIGTRRKATLIMFLSHI